MKILISNDDGIGASGIRALSQALSFENDVYIVAPDRERSAAGHSLTLHSPLRVEMVEARFGSKKTWITSGTPGDCIKLALNEILAKNEKPDIIISGINHGPNLGVDILYSGTVSCAMEGAMLGYPSIAVSLSSMNATDEDFVFTSQFITNFLPKIKKINFPKKSILNINTPSLPKEDIAGIAITRLGTHVFSDKYEKRLDPRGKTYYWMAGELLKYDKNDDTDICAIMSNKISITPITFEMTYEKIIPELTKAFCTENGNCDWF